MVRSAVSCRFFDDRRLQALLVGLGDVVDLDVGEAAGAVDADELGVLVDLAAGEGVAAWHAHRSDAAARGGGAAEHLEGDVLHRVGDIGEFERDAQVGLVRAVATHRLGVGHAREGRGQFHVHRFLEHEPDHFLDQGGDLVLVHERGLEVDLGEFGLAVGAQVLVAEALDDLVVAIVAGHHQQLLEELRRLRQGEELARVHARGHQVVARAFRRALGEHRRLDVDEAGTVEEATEGHRGLVAQHQVLLHLRAPQVDDAVGQAHRLGEVLLVELERRRGGGVEHLDVVAEDLDLARGQVGVLGAGGTAAHLAAHLQHELVAHRLGGLEHLGAVGIAHHLHQALAVAQVDEDDATVVAAAMHPAADGDDLVEVGGGDFSAVVSSHFVFRRFGGACARGFRIRQGGEAGRSGVPGSGLGQRGHGFRLRPAHGRGDDPHRDDVLERVVHAHVELDDFAAPHVVRKKPEVGLGVVGT